MVRSVGEEVFDFLLRINRCFLFRGRNKRGDMDIDEIMKIAFVLLVLLVMLGGIVFLFSGKGGRLLESIKNMFRFGG